MFDMNPQHVEYIALALFVASELIAMNPKMRSNSVLQLLLSTVMRAFPYERKSKPQGPLAGLLDRQEKRGRR